MATPKPGPPLPHKYYVLNPLLTERVLDKNSEYFFNFLKFCAKYLESKITIHNPLASDRTYTYVLLAGCVCFGI